MAFGLPAYHEEDITLPFPVTLEWAFYACQMAKLGAMESARAQTGLWFIYIVTDPTNTSLHSWGQKMVVSPIAPNVLHIRSECAMPTQTFDSGQNKQNVRWLIQIMWWLVRQTPQPPLR